MSILRLVVPLFFNYNVAKMDKKYFIITIFFFFKWKFYLTEDYKRYQVTIVDLFSKENETI